MSDLNLRSLLYCLCPQMLRPYWDRIDASEIGARMARGFFWSISGAVISRGLMLVASIMVARMLGREVYGEYGIIRSTMNMFLVFAGFGLGLTATKHVAEFKLTDPVRAGRVMAISGLFAMGSGALVAVGVFIFAPLLASQTINAPHLAGELRIGAVILFISALNGAQTGALAGFEAFKAIALVNLWVGLISFPLLVGGAYFGGLRGAVWALCANIAINWVLNHLALRKVASSNNVPFHFGGCTKEWPLLWKFSLPATLGGIMVSPVMWACNALLVNQPNGYGQMGLFDAANQWRAAILFVPGMVGQIVLPLLSGLNAQNEIVKFSKVLKYNTVINAGVAIAVALPIALASRFILKSYGPGFEEGMLVLILMAFSTVLVAINNVVGQAIVSKGRMWIGLVFNSTWAATLLTASYILIQRGHGALGLAWANLIAYVMHSIWQYVYVNRMNQLRAEPYTITKIKCQRPQ
jgi:O-antigen/teichoic acid export membrane protein